MRMYKLLFFFLALITLNSCVEYVDNGVKPENGETPEEKKFVAALKETTAKYVGDKFEFEAKLNGIDVTSTTKFTVNGTDIKGSQYVPFKEGSHSVIATMDNLTATFKFTVQPKEEEPEPEPEDGNRIEYAGKSYPVSETVWILHVKGGNVGFFQDPKDTTKVYTLWAMASSKYDSNDEPINQFVTLVYVPVKADGSVAFPNEATGPFMLYGGNVTINGNEVFTANSVSYTFASTGNTVPPGWQTAPTPWSGKGNYTADATGEKNGEAAKLFWNGDYNAGPNQLVQKAKAGNLINGSKTADLQGIQNVNFNKKHIETLKIVK